MRSSRAGRLVGWAAGLPGCRACPARGPSGERSICGRGGCPALPAPAPVANQRGRNVSCRKVGDVTGPFAVAPASDGCARAVITASGGARRLRRCRDGSPAASWPGPSDGEGQRLRSARLSRRCGARRTRYAAIARGSCPSGRAAAWRPAGPDGAIHAHSRRPRSAGVRGAAHQVREWRWSGKPCGVDRRLLGGAGRVSGAGGRQLPAGS